MTQEEKEQLTAVVESVEDGHADPIEAYHHLTQIAKLAKECADQIRDIAVTEAEKHPEKTFEQNGLKITLNSGRRSFDFKECRSWVEVKEQLKEREIVLKRNWEFANANPGAMAADADGVEIELPKVTYSKPSLIINEVQQ